MRTVVNHNVVIQQQQQQHQQPQQLPQQQQQPCQQQPQPSNVISMPTIYSGDHRKVSKPSIVELVLYNMSSMLASVASGYDVRASNVSPIHPKLQMQMFNSNSDNGCSPDSTNVMAQTNYLDENEFYSNERTGYAHNTYHGPTKHIRYMDPRPYSLLCSFCNIYCA